MIFSKQKNNTAKLLYLANYYPYRDGNNPNFDEFSAKILDLKKDKSSAIIFFSEMLEKAITHEKFAIAVVPSHSSNNNSLSGISKVAKRLVDNQDNRINAIFCLRRYKTIAKLAHGGNRDMNIHFNSILVDDPHLIRGQDVLLLDDVYTTGNSMNACSKLLADAGAKSIHQFTLSITRH